MELWDQRVEPYAERLEEARGAVLCDLALDVVEATLPLFDPPFATFFPAEHAALIRSAVDVRRSSPAEWWRDTGFAEGFLARYDALPEVPVRPAVGPFMTATVRLFEALPEPLTADDAMEVLSSCYEAVLMSHLTGRVTLEDEENSDRCRAAVEQQIRIIEDRVPSVSAGS
ncbi:hypothetical protein [Streptomyces sp. SLBN-115]|uniref:hypothetical protein n=1 Tax=Streptomyces sp. SLBN-115 TaxID=2768453 RepID=UPI00114E12B3|nr:hypothetical protein [Streptomyces sp. SLBN-115]TQJ53641.1 hypothetical protein FBY34_1379 [Streptomyces sp. SLBN-115]